MATLYTRIYTYTGQRNTPGSGSVAIADFAISGDTSHAVEQIVSIRYEHYHSSTGIPTWPLTGRLLLSDGTGIDSDTVSYKFNSRTILCENHWVNLPTAAQFAQITQVQTIAGVSAGSGALYWRATDDYPMRLVVEFYDTPPVVYAPKVTKFEAWRVDGSGVRADDGQYIRATVRLNLASVADAALSSLKLYYSAGEVSTDSNAISFTAVQISGMLAGDYTMTISGIYTSGSDWHLLLAYSCGDETSLARITVPRAFATLHLSPCKTGGAAFGGFSTSEEGSPKLESHYPAYFYGGIAQIGSGGADVLPSLGLQHGAVEAMAMQSGDAQVFEIAFEKPYSAPPVVVAGLQSDSERYYMGRCSCTVKAVTAADCTLQLNNYSGSSTEMNIGAYWLALGTLA